MSCVHADGVAEIIGEPYGTLILTLSVTTIEVLSISAVMLRGENHPVLVRDTLFFRGDDHSGRHGRVCAFWSGTGGTRNRSTICRAPIPILA